MAESTTRTTVYDQEYFSSSQVNLYIGDVLIDECCGLQVVLTQRKRPLYGYASELFDATARGTVIVQGSIEINFKESGYIFTVLNRLKKLAEANGTSLISPFVTGKGFDANKRGARRGADTGGLLVANVERVLNAEQELGQSLRSDLTREDVVKYYNDLTEIHQEANAFNNDRGALNPAEDVFEAFEDRVWGKQKLDDEPRRIDDSTFDDFTIYVSYGNFNTNNKVNHTARRIDGVRLIGQAKTISNDGGPVKESYQFIARNWV